MGDLWGLLGDDPLTDALNAADASVATVFVIPEALMELRVGNGEVTAFVSRADIQQSLCEWSMTTKYGDDPRFTAVSRVATETLVCGEARKIFVGSRVVREFIRTFPATTTWEGVCVGHFCRVLASLSEVAPDIRADVQLFEAALNHPEVLAAAALVQSLAAGDQVGVALDCVTARLGKAGLNSEAVSNLLWLARRLLRSANDSITAVRRQALARALRGLGAIGGLNGKEVQRMLCQLQTDGGESGAGSGGGAGGLDVDQAVALAGRGGVDWALVPRAAQIIREADPAVVLAATKGAGLLGGLQASTLTAVQLQLAAALAKAGVSFSAPVMSKVRLLGTRFGGEVPAELTVGTMNAD